MSSEEQETESAPLEERVQIGLGPGGIIVGVEGETASLSPDEAFRIAGQLQASATIMIHGQYAALARQRGQEEEFLRKTKGGVVMPNATKLS